MRFYTKMRKFVYVFLGLITAFIISSCEINKDSDTMKNSFVITQGWPPFDTYELTEEECENASTLFQDMNLQEFTSDEISLGEGIDFSYFDGKKEIEGNIRSKDSLIIDGTYYVCNQEDAFCEYVQEIYLRQFPYGN